MRTFVIGDIHGQYKEFVECLQACWFDYEKDRLIALGDVCDRGPKVKECIDEILKIRHMIYILGNHDLWALEWATNGQLSQEWIDQGGTETMVSYKRTGMPKAHFSLLANASLYFEENGRLFVHAGFDVDCGVIGTPKEVLLWDRAFLDSASQQHQSSPEWRFGDYTDIFVGHTPTLLYGKNVPVQFCNVWDMDTGACFDGGKLTIMDVETKQFWQN